MTQLSFQAYIKNHSLEDSPAGDFICDAKRSPPPADIKDVSELRDWLERQGAIPAAIVAAETVWHRYLAARDGVAVELGRGLTVRQLIEELQRRPPDAHVVKYHPGGRATASRVLGLSTVTVINGPGGSEVPAVMLE